MEGIEVRIMTKATRITLESFERRVDNLKSQYESLRDDFDSLDKSELCYETDAITILMSMRELRVEFAVLENTIGSLKAANREV